MSLPLFTNKQNTPEKMACELTAGIALDCKDAIGGIKAIYVQQYEDFLTGVTIDATTLEVEALPTATLYKVDVRIGSGSLQFEPTTSVENNTIFWTHTISCIVPKMSAAKRKQIELLAKNRLALFVLDSNGSIWMCGKLNGCDMTAGPGGTGTATGDLNGWTLTFTAQDSVQPYRLESYTTNPFDNFAGISVSATQV